MVQNLSTLHCPQLNRLQLIFPVQLQIIILVWLGVFFLCWLKQLVQGRRSVHTWVQLQQKNPNFCVQTRAVFMRAGRRIKIFAHLQHLIRVYGLLV